MHPLHSFVLTAEKQQTAMEVTDLQTPARRAHTCGSTLGASSACSTPPSPISLPLLCLPLPRDNV